MEEPAITRSTATRAFACQDILELTVRPVRSSCCIDYIVTAVYKVAVLNKRAIEQLTIFA